MADDDEDLKFFKLPTLEQEPEREQKTVPECLQAIGSALNNFYEIVAPTSSI